MKTTEIEGDKLITILKETELDKPTKNFTDRLAHLVVHSYKRNYTAEYKKEEWLGKGIIIILVFFNLLMLYYLDPFAIQPVLCAGIAAFILGLIMLILVIKRLKNSAF